MAQKQLMLKEYLELEWTDEPHGTPLPSDAASATVRYLLETELRRSVDCGRQKLPQTLSMRALTKISSAALSAIRLIALAAGKSSGRGRRPMPQGLSVARSLSMRFRPGSSLRTRPKEAESTDAPPTSLEEKAINGGSSFSFPSPVVSNRSSCSESDTVSISVPISSSSSSDVDISASTGAVGARKVEAYDILSIPDSIGKNTGASAAVDHHEESPAPECQSSSESEQLSPVAVMDFPSEEEEEEEEEDDDDDDVEGEKSIASFDQSLAKLERTKLQLLQKIRRFECLADLDLQFTSTDEDEEEDGDAETSDASQEKKAQGLFRQLKAGCRRGDLHGGVGLEKLLVDFFVNGLSCSGCVERALVETAMEWVEDRRRRKLNEYEEEVTLRETELEGRRWRFGLEEEEEEVGLEVGGLLLGALVEEMVAELVI